VDYIYLKGYLHAHVVAEIISYDICVGEKCIKRPTAYDILAVDSSSNLSSSTSSFQLKIIVKGQKIDSHLIECIDCKGRFEHNICQFDFFHFKEKVQPPIRRYLLGLI